jgi:hypothetical protein
MFENVSISPVRFIVEHVQCFILLSLRQDTVIQDAHRQNPTFIHSISISLLFKYEIIE